MLAPGYRVDWGRYRALEPRLDEVASHARDLAAAYNHPLNAPLLGHTDPISETEVVDHYEAMLDAGARMFLLYDDGVFAGDADLRKIAHGAAEFAFMIADPTVQGRGLGTRFAVMVHAFAFQALALDRVFGSVVPANTASLRVFEKLGYARDNSPAARAFADAPGDLTLGIERITFEGLHVADLAEIHVGMR